MTEKLRTDIALISGMLKCAHQASCTLADALADPETKPEAIARQFDATCSLIENAAVNMRNTCEHDRPKELINITKPPLPDMSVAGRINVNHFGWLHIELNTLLPHCRFQSPVYITDTIVRLLDEYEKRHTPVRFDEALLVIDEYCDLSTRTVYDQDNSATRSYTNTIPQGTNLVGA